MDSDKKDQNRTNKLLADDLEYLRSQVNSLKQELEKEKKKHEKDTETARFDLKNMMAEVEKLKEQNCSLQEDLDEAEDQLINLVGNNNTKNENVSLKKDIRILKKEYDEVVNQLNAAQEESKCAISEANTLREKMIKQRVELEAKMASEKNMWKELEQNREDMKKMMNETTKQRISRDDDKSSEYNRLKYEVDDLRRKNENKDMLINELRLEINKLCGNTIDVNRDASIISLESRGLLSTITTLDDYHYAFTLSLNSLSIIHDDLIVNLSHSPFIASIAMTLKQLRIIEQFSNMFLSSATSSLSSAPTTNYIHDLESQIAAIKHQNDLMVSSINELTFELSSLKKENEMKAQQIKESARDIQTLVEINVDKNHPEFSSYYDIDENSMLDGFNEEKLKCILKTKIVEARNEKEDLRSEIVEARKELEKDEKSIVRMENTISSLQLQLQNGSVEIMNKENEIDSLKSTVDRLQKKVEETTKETKEVTKTESKEDKDLLILELQEKLKDKETEIVQLNDKMEELEDEILDDTDELEKCKKELKECMLVRDKLRVDVKELNEDNDDLLEEIEELKQKLNGTATEDTSSKKVIEEGVVRLHSRVEALQYINENSDSAEKTAGIRYLDMNNCNLENEDVAVFSTILDIQGFIDLQVLILSNNRINLRGFTSLLHSLTEQTYEDDEEEEQVGSLLLKLDFSHNSIPSKGLLFLLNLLKEGKFPLIQEIDLSYNDIDDKDSKKIISAMEDVQLSTLQSIKLEGNRLSQKTLDEVNNHMNSSLL